MTIAFIELPSQAAKPPIRWPGGGAAVGRLGLHGVTAAALPPADFALVGGSRRAAVGQAREAACSLE